MLLKIENYWKAQNVGTLLVPDERKKEMENYALTRGKSDSGV